LFIFEPQTYNDLKKIFSLKILLKENVTFIWLLRII
jgi:hypothetical protein